MALSPARQQLPAVDMHSVESPDTGRNTGRQFSIGLALTLVTVGVGAAISVSRSQNAGADLTLSLNAPPIFQSVDWLSWCVYGRTWLHGHMR